MGAQSLAAAVLARALADADGRPFTGTQYPGRKRIPVLVVDRDVESAIEFLCTESPDLQFWCTVAELPVQAVLSRAQRELRGKRAAIGQARRRYAEALEA